MRIYLILFIFTFLLASESQAKNHNKTITKKDTKQIKLRSNMNVLKRYGRSEEVAHLMIYLISDKSNFITGENIPITGGDWL